MPFFNLLDISCEHVDLLSDVDSDDDVGAHQPGPKKQTHQKQNPAERNAVLLTIVSARFCSQLTSLTYINLYRNTSWLP